MVRPAEGHSWRPLCVAANPNRANVAQRGVWAQPVVLEEGKADGRIPGMRVFGEGVCFARQVVHTVVRVAVELLGMRHARTLHRRPDRRARLDAQQAAARVVVCDRLRQAGTTDAQRTALRQILVTLAPGVCDDEATRSILDQAAQRSPTGGGSADVT